MRDGTTLCDRQGVLQLLKFDATGNTVWTQDLNNARPLWMTACVSNCCKSRTCRVWNGALQPP